MKVSEMVQVTREIAALFDQAAPRPWGIEAMMTELVGEVGSLADAIMLTEDYRLLRKQSNPDLEDEIADTLFMLIRIADYYNIDLERAYIRMIHRTRRKLEKRIPKIMGH